MSEETTFDDGFDEGSASNPFTPHAIDRTSAASSTYASESEEDLGSSRGQELKQSPSADTLDVTALLSPVQGTFFNSVFPLTHRTEEKKWSTVEELYEDLRQKVGNELRKVASTGLCRPHTLSTRARNGSLLMYLSEQILQKKRIHGKLKHPFAKGQRKRRRNEPYLNQWQARISQLVCLCPPCSAHIHMMLL